MGSVAFEKPHAVCVPYPSQGHISPLLRLAKVLHARGFHITFVNTEFNHNRLLKSRGPDSLNGFDDFQFESIPDGLPPSDINATQDLAAISESTSKNCFDPFRQLIKKLNHNAYVPRISCIISDGIMTFTLPVAEEFGLPQAWFWTASAVGFMTYLHYRKLVDIGLIPFKDENFLTNRSMDTRVDWVPAMKGLRLRDFPMFVRTTDPNDIMLNFFIKEMENASKGSAIIFNTFDDMECDVLNAIRAMFPNIYTVGPVNLLCNQLPKSPLDTIGSNLWKEDDGCLEWLDTQNPGSVLFVSYGSITVLTAEQVIEFAWGLANSNHSFLWIVRPDLVMGESAVLPQEFLDSIKGRSRLASWCSQEQVLAHPSVGGFLTHCGWNSTLESVCGGVPILCWPFIDEQHTNCLYACTEWGIGMEIDSNVKRDEVAGLVRELMEGEKGKEMKRKAIKWKKCAENAVKKGGSSYANLDKAINDVLRPKAKAFY